MSKGSCADARLCGKLLLPLKKPLRRGESNGRFGSENRVVTPGRFELPTCGLGNRRSIHLSYGAIRSTKHLRCFCAYLTGTAADKSPVYQVSINLIDT